MGERSRAISSALRFALFAVFIATAWLVLGSATSASADSATDDLTMGDLLGAVSSTVDAPTASALVHQVTTTIPAVVRAAPAATTASAQAMPAVPQVDDIVTALPVTSEIHRDAPVETIVTNAETGVDGLVGAVASAVTECLDDIAVQLPSQFRIQLPGKSLAAKPEDRAVTRLAASPSAGVAAEFAPPGLSIGADPPPLPTGLPTQNDPVALTSTGGANSTLATTLGDRFYSLPAALGIPSDDDTVPTSLALEPGSSPD